MVSTSFFLEKAAGKMSVFRVILFCISCNQNEYGDPVNICLFKVNNRNTRKRCEIYSKLTIKASERHH